MNTPPFFDALPDRPTLEQIHQAERAFLEWASRFDDSAQPEHIRTFLAERRSALGKTPKPA